MANLQAEFRKLRPGQLITLYQAITSELGASTDLQFYNPKDPAAPNIVFQTKTYSPWPLAADGFEMNVKGPLPRPVIAIGNVNGTVSALCRNYKDLVGCEVVRIRTLAEFLDAPVGTVPDPTQFVQDRFRVDRKRTENNTVVEFELATRLDAEGKTLPGRQMLANSCQWLYRGEECAYSGLPIGPADDSVIGPHFTTGVGNGSTTFTATGANFTSTDFGRAIVGDSNTFIPRDTAIVKVVSTTNVTLSRAVKVGSSIGFRVAKRLTGRGPYVAGFSYNQWDTAYTISGGNVQLWWISLINSNNFPLTNEVAWALDRCGKRLHSCKLRFGPNSVLRTSAFPGINKLVSA